MSSDPTPTDPTGSDAPIGYDRVIRLSPRVRRLTQSNPGPFTGPGTNTFIVGGAQVVVLEPGQAPDDAHVEQVARAVGDARVVLVVPSHGHEDHWTLAPRLAKRLGAPVGFLDPKAPFRVDRLLRDDEVLALGDTHLRVLHTPGHTPDHLSFLLEEEGALFPGDHVMGWSTSIIAPPEGDLRAYLRSLDRLLGRTGLRVAHPAHGAAIPDPYSRMRELYAHREARSRQALAALAAGPRRIGALVEEIYADVDPALHPAAAQSLAAHLLALEAEGLIERAPESEGVAWEDLPWSRVERSEP